MRRIINGLRFIAAMIDLLTPTFYLWGDHVIEKGHMGA